MQGSELPRKHQPWTLKVLGTLLSARDFRVTWCSFFFRICDLFPCTVYSSSLSHLVGSKLFQRFPTWTVLKILVIKKVIILFIFSLTLNEGSNYLLIWNQCGKTIESLFNKEPQVESKETPLEQSKNSPHSHRNRQAKTRRTKAEAVVRESRLQKSGIRQVEHR